jgi:hypothetical protein
MSFGGFPRNLFIGSAPDDLEVVCKTCNYVVCEPIQCCLGHIFCDFCTVLDEDGRVVCPSCTENDNNIKTEKMKVDFRRNTKAINAIQYLQVKCHNNDKCDWNGMLIDQNQHVCIYKSFQCTNEGCAEIINTFTQFEHSIVCHYRTVICSDCNASILGESLHVHLMICPERPISCECGFAVSIANISVLTTHKQTDCVLNHRVGKLSDTTSTLKSVDFLSVSFHRRQAEKESLVCDCGVWCFDIERLNSHKLNMCKLQVKTQQRSIKCRLCKSNFNLCNLTSHLSSCNERPIKCVCGEIVPAKKLVFHKKNECFLPCKYCNWMIRFMRTADHLLVCPGKFSVLNSEIFCKTVTAN